jgi:deoxyribodipyrimidine photo-lyase
MCSFDKCCADAWWLQVCAAVSIPVCEVDTHNIVPVWVASDKREYGARTIRRKIQDKLPEFLVEFPELPRPAEWGADLPQPPAVDWEVGAPIYQLFLHF